MHAAPQRAPDEVTSVTGTAFVVAEYRAEENYAVEPLYRDEVVGIYLSAASRRAAAQVAGEFTEVRELVKLRTRYYDDMLERQILAGCRQVVVLGAGLDTRAVRKAAPGVRFFEIDDRAILRQLAGGVAQVRVSFDYFVPEVITRTTGNEGMTRMADSFTAMNAPWVTGFADVRQLGAETGLMLIENVTTAVLSHIYRPRAAAPTFGPYYAIATLGSF